MYRSFGGLDWGGMGNMSKRKLIYLDKLTCTLTCTKPNLDNHHHTETMKMTEKKILLLLMAMANAMAMAMAKGARLHVLVWHKNNKHIFETTTTLQTLTQS